MKKIIEAIIELLGDEYKVINNYNNDDLIDLDGVIAVSVSNIQYLHQANDKRVTIEITGQINTEQDLNQSKIMNMLSYVEQIMENTNLTNYINNKITEENYGVAGYLLNTQNIVSNGETNAFSFSFDLFICRD